MFYTFDLLIIASHENQITNPRPNHQSQLLS